MATLLLKMGGRELRSLSVSKTKTVIGRDPNCDVHIDNPSVSRHHARIQKSLSLMSPMELYSDATATIIDPMRRTTRTIVSLGMMERFSLSRFSGPLPLSQSILVVLPYITFLIAITLICFAVSYIVFMRQEIRSL